jgi:DNA helicase-2/ATP-dependent DNA helicase PcrA
LTRRNIPFVKFGDQIPRAAHIKDVLAVLRFLRTRVTASPASARCSSFPASACRPDARHDRSRCRYGDRIVDLSPAYQKRCRLASVRRTLQGSSKQVRSMAIDIERVRLWYEPHLERLHEDAQAPRGLLQLEQIAAGYRRGNNPTS